MVAEVGEVPEADQMYRITFDGSVADEHGFVAMGGQADQVAMTLKEHYTDGLTLAQALGVAIEALSGQVKGAAAELTATQLEVAVLDRDREHRTFRRLTGSRLTQLLAEARPGGGAIAGAPGELTAGGDAEPGTPTSPDGGAGPATQPARSIWDTTRGRWRDPGIRRIGGSVVNVRSLVPLDTRSRWPGSPRRT